MSNLHASLYVPKEEDIFLFDTNILIYIFYPVMNSFSTKTYVTLYTQALKNKCTLVLPAIQLSEFINRCIRFQFELYRDTQDKNAIIDFKKDDAYIVTHDADFGNYHTKLPIITDNRLLALFNTK